MLGAIIVPPRICAWVVLGRKAIQPAKTEPSTRNRFMGHLGAPPLGRPLAFQIALHSRCAQFSRGFKGNCRQAAAATPSGAVFRVPSFHLVSGYAITVPPWSVPQSN